METILSYIVMSMIAVLVLGVPVGVIVAIAFLGMIAAVLGPMFAFVGLMNK